MVKPYYQRGDVTLYHGDCLEILPTLEAGSVDAVVTDPPYGINHTTSHGASWAGMIISGDCDTKSRDSVIEWANGRPWAVWGNYKSTPPKGFKAKIVWDKGPAFGAGDLSFPWKPSFEECWFSKGPWKSSYRGEGVWRGPCVVSWETVAGGRVHPHQKPDWLFRKIILALPSVDTFIDPFTGSGTTGVACVQLGRKFIGIEIEEKYCEIAAKRLDNAINEVESEAKFFGKGA